MPAIVLEPSAADYRLDGARWERLASELRESGWQPRIAVNATERRSAVTELVVRLLDKPDGAAVDALAASLAAHVSQSLARRRKERGRVVIYAAAGPVLRIVEVAGPENGVERRGAHTRS